ncbi:hypothetical protein ACJJIW_11235 [Microbulbifer sp. JMSA004]|uniref:hypothetical protein n=1 Tax=unclassified Microbulbifer TaxID=2619833 RepID=UPI0024AD233A|nr:hypothetical protein [Microbulbifer sp. VAAF005]WHI45859.1 hypothetical protein P0078_19385 [Microbulbifer sp. VAAF005]
MRGRNITIDGEPVRICRYRSGFNDQPMYAICILNYTKYVRSFSVFVDVNLRSELELTLAQMREVERSMNWMEVTA